VLANGAIQIFELPQAPAVPAPPANQIGR
jgi:hypothetical protein